MPCKHKHVTDGNKVSWPICKLDVINDITVDFKQSASNNKKRSRMNCTHSNSPVMMLSQTQENLIRILDGSQVNSKKLIRARIKFNCTKGSKSTTCTVVKHNKSRTNLKTQDSRECF
jgi:hypothetical protein